MQNEFDSPDESEWDEEEPYYDWDDPDWREDWDEAEAPGMRAGMPTFSRAASAPRPRSSSSSPF